MRSTSPLLAAAAAAVTILAAPLGAQSDDETLARYQLTDAALAKFTQATRNVIAAAQAQPEAFREREGADDATIETIAEMAAVYERYPALKRAINAGGMTTREYVVFLMSMTGAAMGALLVEQQQGKFDNLPAGISRANVLFYQRHKTELERINEELRALEGRDKTPPADEEPPGSQE
ncbi:MAG TPA: hypothetical protein VFU41_11075 [Gemmatimonadales bacterium]|nr:hypothetical protein [Gemmatimonadales bacterium]